MNKDVSSINESFNILSRSPEFLDILIHNLGTCILLLDKNMRLLSYNDALKCIFSNRENEHLQFIKCGEAIGCASTIEEEAECGETSQCQFCELRKAALLSYVEKRSIYKQKISRDFFNRDSEKVTLHICFSTRPIFFKNQYQIIMLIDQVPDPGE